MAADNFLEQLDHQLFHWINTGLSNSVADAFFPNITDLHKNIFFVALVGLMLAYWLFKGKWATLRLMAGLGITAGLSDLVAYRIVKIPFHRLRPEAVLGDVILRTHSHSGFSFPSNHASNAFALATFLALTYPKFQWLFWTIASLVAISRVYVGVHFPSDIIGGAILGSLIGLTGRWIYVKVELVLQKRSNKKKYWGTAQRRRETKPKDLRPPGSKES